MEYLSTAFLSSCVTRSMRSSKRSYTSEEGR